MNTPITLETILETLRGLILSNVVGWPSILLEPKELYKAKQHEKGEAFLRELHAPHYEGEPMSEELKKTYPKATNSVFVK